MNQTLTAIQQLFAHEGKHILTLHRRPDGDSIGSCLAFALYLRSLGRDVDIYSIDPVPGFLDFLPGADTVKVEDPKNIPWHNYAVYWALDMAAPEMIGVPEMSYPKELEIVVIDHHDTNKDWGKINHVLRGTISTTFVLYTMFKEMNISISKEVGINMMTGLCTDSGFFNYISDGKPLQMAADLMDNVGVNYQEIVFNIQRNTNIEDVIFLGQALEHMSVDYEKKAAIIAIPHVKWKALGATSDRTYMLMGYLQSINGTDFGFMITEEKPETYRVQFRSRDRSFDVAALASKFGGGGHKNAAGARMEGYPLDVAVKHILAAI